MSEELKNFLQSDKEGQMLSTLAESISLDKSLLSEADEIDIDTLDVFASHVANISWGIPMIDNKLGAKPNGKFEIFYGAAGSGKTTFTLQAGIENAKIGNKVCYLSFEMSAKDLIIQNCLKHAGIGVQKIGESIKPTPEQIRIVNEYKRDLSLIDIKSFPRQPSLKDYKEILDSIKEIGYDYIIVDNLGLIGRSDGIDEMSLYARISGITKEFVDTGGGFIQLIHHSKKGAEGGNGKRGFGAFRGNGKIVDDTDLLVQIIREYDEETGQSISSLLVEKDRQYGQAGTKINLLFNKGNFTMDIF